METANYREDSDLLDAMRNGRELNLAVKQCYALYFDILSLYIRNNNGNEQDAEDIIQEVMVSFVELVRLNKFRGESSIKTFLYALTRNIWLNELKKRGRSNIREARYENDREQIDAGIAHYIAGREARRQVMEIVNTLGENCRKILLAFYYENLPMKEILLKLEYSNEQVVRNKKYKCLKQLEEMLHANPQLAKSLKIALQYEP